MIHSFWVPQLAGKMDVIPGQTNVTWLQADKPGIYRGQCGEYCGAQHAHMAMYVVADTPRGLRGLGASGSCGRAPRRSPAALRRGQQTFVAHCGACHAVRGTGAGGILGPDLTHLMSRQTHRRRPAAQHARQPVGVDRQCAGAQARHAHAHAWRCRRRS